MKKINTTTDELLLSLDDEKEILEILEKDEFVSIEKVREELKI